MPLEEENLGCRPQNCVCKAWGATGRYDTLRSSTCWKFFNWSLCGVGKVYPQNFRGASPGSAGTLPVCIFILKCVYRCVEFLEGVRVECLEAQWFSSGGNGYFFQLVQMDHACGLLAPASVPRSVNTAVVLARRMLCWWSCLTAQLALEEGQGCSWSLLLGGGGWGGEAHRQQWETSDWLSPFQVRLSVCQWSGHKLGGTLLSSNRPPFSICGFWGPVTEGQRASQALPPFLTIVFFLIKKLN